MRITVALGLLLCLVGLTACAGASAGELTGFAQRIGLPTERSRAVEDNTAVYFDLNEKCEGQLFSDWAPGTVSNAQYHLNVRVKGLPRNAPSVALLVGEEELTAFAEKLKDSSKELDSEIFMYAKELTEACW